MRWQQLIASEVQTSHSGVYACVLPQSLCTDALRVLLLFFLRSPSLPLLVSPDFQCESIRRVSLQKAPGTRRAWQLPPPLPPNSGTVVTLAPRAERGLVVFSLLVPAVNAPIDLGFWILLQVACSLQSWRDVCLKMQTGF